MQLSVNIDVAVSKPAESEATTGGTGGLHLLYGAMLVYNLNFDSYLQSFSFLLQR